VGIARGHRDPDRLARLHRANIDVMAAATTLMASSYLPVSDSLILDIFASSQDLNWDV
jgi:hypothetical protein